MNAPRDPQGRRALFSEVGAPRSAAPGPADGKAALFSAAVRRPGTVVVQCEGCGARSRVSYVDLARRHLPVWLWAPWRRHSRWIACPACAKRSWMAVSWLG